MIQGRWEFNMTDVAMQDRAWRKWAQGVFCREISTCSCKRKCFCDYKRQSHRNNFLYTQLQSLSPLGGQLYIWKAHILRAVMSCCQRLKLVLIEKSKEKLSCEFSPWNPSLFHQLQPTIRSGPMDWILHEESTIKKPFQLLIRNWLLIRIPDSLKLTSGLNS